ncbi:MAG: biopolymer transporter ExbD [Thermodesulfobacteriota bacterium]
MDETEFNTLNVIPLVDVMLVLLTIVLMTSTFIAVGGLSIELPQAAGEKVEMLKTLTIEIDSEGTIFLEAAAISLAGLTDSLAGTDKETPLIIRADKKLALQHFVEVMSAAKALGFTKVSLQTEVTS